MNTKGEHASILEDPVVRVLVFSLGRTQIVQPNRGTRHCPETNQQTNCRHDDREALAVSSPFCSAYRENEQPAIFYNIRHQSAIY